MLYLLLISCFIINVIVKKSGAKVTLFCEVYLHYVQKCDYIVGKSFVSPLFLK